MKQARSFARLPSMQRMWLTINCCLGLVIGLNARGWAIEPIAIEFLWQSEPKLEYDWFRKPSGFNVAITAKQLNAQPARERMDAAQSILRVPSSPALNRTTLLADLLKRLDAGEPHRDVRVELVAAACELDDGTNAARLWKLAQSDPETTLVVQRACIGWRKPEPLEYWRKSLASDASSEQALSDAVDGIGAAGSAEDLKALESLVLDGTRSATLRLGSARAIGRLSTADQMALAQKLRASSAANAELLAVEVLAKSPAASSTEFVQEIALRGQLLAQRAAYRWLCERDSSTAERLLGDFLKHSDSEARLLALNQLTIVDNEQTMPGLFEALGDVNSNVREAARLHVLKCCTKSEKQRQIAHDLLIKNLGSDDWRQLEHLIRLTVELDQKMHCERLVSLIDHPRPEVCINASWALRHLADDEAILGRMLDYVKHMTGQILAGSEAVNEMHLQGMAHLMEAFGHRKYEPAKDTLIKYVPKNFNLGLITRMTAIWSCGKLWEHAENKALIKELHARIADKDTMFPEAVSLRFAATLALGWIADPNSREPLNLHNEPIPTSIGYATEWALKRLDER